jgi:uncharacterized protein YecT (DUF1311 family)
MNFDEASVMTDKIAVVSLCLLSCIIPGSTLLAQDQACETLPTTPERADCLDQQLANAEADMNRAFQQAISKYLPSAERDSESPKMSKVDLELLHEADKRTARSLRQSQARWLAYRESACTAVANMYDGGTITVEAVPACKTELTQQRTAWLRSYFASHNTASNAKSPGKDPSQK